MREAIVSVMSVGALGFAGAAAGQTGMLLDYAADQMVQKFKE